MSTSGTGVLVIPESSTDTEVTIFQVRVEVDRDPLCVTIAMLDHIALVSS